MFINPNSFIGARPGTQALDIAFACQQVIEKGLDQFSQGCVGSIDIRQYYDSMPLSHVVQVLINKGIDPGLCCAVLACQLCPIIILCLLGAEAVVSNRSLGGITGTRLAGVLGHVIVMDLIEVKATSWNPYAFPLGNSSLACATWIDNIFTFSKSCAGAAQILEQIEQYLLQKWSLEIKASSRSMLVCRGGDTSAVPPNYECSSSLNVLGHHVQCDAGARAEWRSMRGMLWGCFWKNAGNRSVSTQSTHQKIMLLCRSVYSRFAWKFGRWPYQKSIAIEMDQMQSKMVSVLLNLPKSPLEDIEGYCRRRSRVARKVSAEIGLWSLMWAEKVINWHEHVLRGAKHSSRSDGEAYLSMNANLIHFHDAKWLFHKRSQWTAQNYL